MKKQAVFIGDIVEANGKTLKDNNLGLDHTIPLGSLVEVREEDGVPGVRLYVVKHTRDCDGTPLYGLSPNKNAPLTEVYRRADNSTDELIKWAISLHEKWSIKCGYSERSLELITMNLDNEKTKES